MGMSGALLPSSVAGELGEEGEGGGRGGRPEEGADPAASAFGSALLPALVLAEGVGVAAVRVAAALEDSVVCVLAVVEAAVFACVVGGVPALHDASVLLDLNGADLPGVLGVDGLGGAVRW